MARYRKYGRRTKKERDDNKKVTKKALRRILHSNIEDKNLFYGWTDIAPISTTVGTQYPLMVPNAVVPPLTGIQGVSDYQRIGSKIRVKSIAFNVNLSLIAGQYSDNVRIMVVRDRQTNGALITTSELLMAVTTGDAPTATYRDSLKHQFEIYYDKVHHLMYSGPIATTDPQTIKDFRFKKYFKVPLTVGYYQNANAGVIADVESNNVSVIIFSHRGYTNALNAYSNVIFEDA